MTKDDILRMAHEAGFLIDTHAQQYQPNCILSTYGVALADAYRCGYEAGVVAERETIAQMLDAIPELVTFARRGDGGCIMCGFSKSHAAKAIRARTTT